MERNAAVLRLPARFLCQLERARGVVPVRIAEVVVAVQRTERVVGPIVEVAASERNTPCVTAASLYQFDFKVIKFFRGRGPPVPLKWRLSLERARGVVPGRTAEVVVAVQRTERVAGPIVEAAASERTLPVLISPSECSLIGF